MKCLIGPHGPGSAWGASCRQCGAVVPGHPELRLGRNLVDVPLQLGQVVERIGAVELAGMNQAHEQITDPGAVQGLIEECVLAIQDGFLQRALDDIMPPPGLCRVLPYLTQPAWFLTVPDAA